MSICLFCCFTSQVNSYGHGGTVSSPNHTFFLGKLEQAVNQYFVHILSLVTDNNPFKGGEWPQKLFHNQSPQKYGTGRGSTCNPRICSQSRICCQTHYRLRYTARCKKKKLTAGQMLTATGSTTDVLQLRPPIHEGLTLIQPLKNLYTHFNCED